MFEKTPRAVYFETRFGIHTFGLKFPIDILILDKSNKIKIIKENFNPNKILFWNPIFKRVIELPEGTIKNKKILANDEVKINFV